MGIEAMIQAAHHHIISDQGAKSPFPSPRSTAAMLITGSVSLQEHMDSFPLVPLSIIPQLSYADLCKCQTALEELLATLSSDSAEDIQLGKYVARQLSLVKRHLELARARERVLQLVKGELPASSLLAQVPSGSKAALPIFLQPPPNERPPPPIFRTNPSSDSLSSAVQGSVPLQSKSISRPSSSAATKAVTTKKADAIQMAKAMIRASKSVTSFVISSSEQGGNTNSHKQRRRKLPRGNKPSDGQSRVQLLERERERRKDAAYQRLLARQELQAKKKAEQQQKKTQKQAQKNAEATVKHETTLLDASEPTPHQLQDDSSSSDESDASEVSNCSEGDEANETAIMALELKTKEPEVDEEHVRDEEHQYENEGGDDEDEADQRSHEDNSESDEDELPKVADLTHSSDSNQDTGIHWSKPDEFADDTISDDRSVCGSPQERQEVPETNSNDWKQTAANDESGALDGMKITETAPISPVARDQDEEIARELQQFISSRTQMMLERLEQQKRERQACTKAPDIGKPFLDPIVSNKCFIPGDHVFIEPSIENIDEDTGMAAHLSSDPTDDIDLPPQQELTAFQSEEYAQDISVADTVGTAITKTPVAIRHPTERSILRKQRSTRSIPRAPAKNCVDYRSYFSHFECILTSIFEQRAASETSNNSVPHLREPSAASDTSLRLQLKLYQSWQSIMHDYATVFGNSIATPTSMMPASSPYTAHYRINSTTRSEVCDIVVTALDKLGDWEEHPSGLGLKTTWNLLWTWSKPRVERKTLLAWQKVNHFQYAKALTRKDCLKKNIGKYLAMGGRMKQAYEMIPATFVLPQEYLAFVQAYQDRKPQLDDPQKNIWIMKPVALSRGRGISLVNNLNDVVYSEPVVIQEYIADPLLLDGYKFDLRLYILVTSFNPLEAFLYEEGFVRMCTRTYDTSDLSNLFVHLTNSSIQKDNQEAIGTRYV